MKNKVATLLWIAALFPFLTAGSLLKAQEAVVLNVSSSPTKVSGAPLAPTVRAGTIVFSTEIPGIVHAGTRLRVTFDVPIDSLDSNFPVFVSHFLEPCAGAANVSFSGSELNIDFASDCFPQPGFAYWIRGVNLSVTGATAGAKLINATISRTLPDPDEYFNTMTFSPRSVPVVELNIP